MPDRIDADNEHFFLMAAFNLGRVGVPLACAPFKSEACTSEAHMPECGSVAACCMEAGQSGSQCWVIREFGLNSTRIYV
eukprot:590994-Pelagomonas_calceolata.AAC.1